MTAKKTSPTPERLGEFLKQARQRLSLTQMEVAKLLGYQTPQFVSEWERGVKNVPTYLFRKILEIYQITPEEFYEILRKERLHKLNEELELDRKALDLPESSVMIRGRR